MNKTLPDEWLRKSHQYLHTLDQEAALKKRREELRDELKQFIMEGEQDENGNYIYEFPDPITLDGETYFRGLQAQRRVSEYANTDTAFQVLGTYDLWDRCVDEVTTYEINWDEVYACNQEGLIPDEDIDAILEHDITYSLVKVK